MYKIDFNDPISVHFIGIGGISMSGLAMMLEDKGFIVTGSDRERTELTERLEEAGMHIGYPQSGENIRLFSEKYKTALVVYTAAIHPDNPEYAEAVKLNIPMMTRAELLGQIMDNYNISVAVAGTHGKTTTTAMISSLLWKQDGLAPTISIGAVYPSIGGNYHIGNTDIFIAEACEYTNSFLSLRPRIGVILNIEADHLDFFKDINDIRASFRRFAEQIKPDGALVIGADIDALYEITEGLTCKRVITFGLSEDADVRAVDVHSTNRDARADDRGGIAFKAVFSDGSAPIDITLPFPGEHNVKNALAAIAVAKTQPDSDDVAIARKLNHFGGAKRRFEKLGVWRGVTIVDDYAHHPTEIRATLTSARGAGYSRVICVFQPHTYTRTKAFLDDFADALSAADVVILAPIYAARETDDLGISSATLCEKIRNSGGSCDHFSSFSEIGEHLEKICSEGDLLIFMGAGEVDKIGFSLLDGTKLPT